MRCFFIFALSVFACYSLAAQKAKKSGVDLNKEFVIIPTDASTDTKAWNAYIKKASVLTGSALADIPAGVYQVSIQFVVDKNGYICDVKATNNPGYGLSNKAEQIISLYEGIWRPALQCGRAVKSYKKQVVEFVVK